MSALFGLLSNPVLIPVQLNWLHTSELLLKPTVAKVKTLYWGLRPVPSSGRLSACRTMRLVPQPLALFSVLSLEPYPMPR
jgi:hypothetical protein